jgi:membrane associated rhomboid family serine protease
MNTYARGNVDEAFTFLPERARRRSHGSMPTCPTCGKNFSGFSFGASPATECPDCRKARAQTQAANLGAIDAANPSTPRVAVRRFPLPAVTLGIIAANVLVYVAMGLCGVSWSEPSVLDSVKWGADFGPLTLSSDWWRLFTSTFVHFGIIHIALNMWCLWNLGTTLEPFMGRKVFGVMYVASGLAASLISTAWNPWRVSAGASGAIFGVAGALVSYFALKKTPLDRALVNRNLKSLGIFIFYNLLYGASGHVDNSAHIGGLISGLLLGAAIPPMVRIPWAAIAAGAIDNTPLGLPDAARANDESRANQVAMATAIASALILVLGFAALHQKKLAVARYGSAVKSIKSGKFNEAIASLQESVKLEPDIYYSQAMLGELQLKLENPAAAVAPLEAASKIQPRSFALEHDLALAYLGAGRPSDAIPLANSSILSQEEALEATKSSDKSAWWATFYIRGVAEAKLSNVDGATRDFRSIEVANPDLTEPKSALAQLQAPKSADSSPQFEIPYAKLVLPSDYWPLYP